MQPTAGPLIPARDFLSIVPEMLLTVLGLVLLIVDFGVLRHQGNRARRLALGGLTLAGVLVTLLVTYLDVPTLAGLDPPGARDLYIFFGTIADDSATVSLNLVILALLALVVGVSMAWRFTEYWGEYFALLVWAAVGMMLLVAAEELLTLFLTLELMTLCLYLLAALEKDRRRSPEAGLKYFVYGSVSSALFLFGLSLLYGLTGSTEIDAIRLALSTGGTDHPGLAGNLAAATAVLLMLVGFGFKIAAVPFHQWAPDTYEGAPAAATAWIAAGSKLASFVAMMKVFNHALYPWSERGVQLGTPGWIGVLAVIAALSMTYGNLAALAQRNFKRLLAYSSIAHAGYILVGVIAVSLRYSNQQAAGAVLYYLVVYAFTTVGAFALAAWLARDKGTDDIDDLNGLGYESPLLAVCIVLLMLSLIGVPPLAGFFGKLYIFMEALNLRQSGTYGLTWLVALALLNSMISAFYYVRVLKAMYLRPPGRVRTLDPSPGLSLPIVLATLVVIIFGVAPTLLLQPMRSAAIMMLTSSASAAAPALPQTDTPPPSPPAPAVAVRRTAILGDRVASGSAARSQIISHDPAVP